jgi:alpha-L-rhamnosidase
MYRHYDDTGVLREHYPTMKRYIEYLRELARTDSNPEEAYIVNDFGGYWESLGEWCSPDRNDCPNRPVVSSFYYYYDTRLFSEIAQRLGHTDDARRYAALCDTIKEEYNRKFFSTQTLLYGMDSIAYQPYQLMALSGGLVPEEYRAGVAKTVADDVIKRGNHLNTGIIGTKYLWPVLCDYGYDELAYSVATQTTYPSYGFWIENHSTTLLEEWGGQNSHNHQMFASILEYFYNYLAGIRMEENGYRKILLAPVMPAALEHAQATLNTMSGPVFSGWDKLKDGGYSYRAKVPANVQATLLLPLKGIKYPVLMEKNKAVWRDNSFIGKVSGIKEAAIKDGAYLKITLGSGDYHFTMSNDRAAL